jgi:DNA polymerase I
MTMADIPARPAGKPGHPAAPTLLLVDGHALAYRALYAVPAELTAPSGEPTGAIHGFMSMLLTLITDRRPDSVVVCFDAGRDVRRTALYPQYKATRAVSPPTLRPQVERIGELLDALNITRIAVGGVEADDVIATVARHATDAGWRCEIATGDRDAIQLVTDTVTVLAPGRSMKELIELTPAAVEAKYGVAPARYLELAALRGDTSDNLPGVPGVGAKTAVKVLTQCVSLGELGRDGAVGVTPARIGVALYDHWDAVERNLALMALRRDVELPVDASALLGQWGAAAAAETGAAVALCGELGLFQVADRLGRLTWQGRG